MHFLIQPATPRRRLLNKINYEIHLLKGNYRLNKLSLTEDKYLSSIGVLYLQKQRARPTVQIKWTYYII